ncbi:hypothetical protein NC796_17170 [Aliifodinibius sp. S!AR15-10]|uniref:hypothetical protein n=1 Tax=Aliifodinibius sp. S!AR15-10 TaxID=2950437 RepID=UPI00286653C5|nr:hypothetical protein [Aliifodinibius sp. S!AR15-10]MDR8392890.1 hypothetical protein [Aliifodinibius sp. S!AR15-10]
MMKLFHHKLMAAYFPTAIKKAIAKAGRFQARGQSSTSPFSSAVAEFISPFEGGSCEPSREFPFERDAGNVMKGSSLEELKKGI